MLTQVETVDVLEGFLATRSPELREKLVLESVPLVHYLLARIGVSQELSSDYEDLAHQGLMGLIEAVDNFDPKHNVRFSTYASLRIRGKILDYLRASDWMPRDARKRTRLIQETISTLWTEKSREPSEEEIAASLGMEVKEVQQGLSDLNRALVSLDLVIEGKSKEGGALHDFLDDENQIDPAETIEREILAEVVGSAIHDLPQREQLVLSLYYNEGLTFKEIGKIFEVTESRVWQMHMHAITFLKARIDDE